MTMKIHLKQKRIQFAAAALMAAVLAGMLSGCNKEAKFRDVEVELGTTTVTMEQFLLPGNKLSKAAFVSDVSTIDLGKIGTYYLTLSYGKTQETVSLVVRDTTPPEATFVAERTMLANETMKIEDFVTDVSDRSGATAAFAEEPEIPKDYSDIVVRTVVTDGNGNSVEGQTKVSFLWMPESLQWEYGKELTKRNILYNAKRDEALLDQADIDKINAAGLGTYTLTSEAGGKKLQCTVTVQDTQGPEVKLQPVHIWPQELVTMRNFIVSVEDPSGVASTELLSEIDTLTKGERLVQIKATDTLGNVTIAETTLKVNLDHNGPVIAGMEDINAEKGVTPDYETGVTVTDDVDGTISFTFDSSAVDLENAGVYFVTYTAEDAAGNVATARRRVIVPPDAADVQALVDEVAAGLSDDPKELRNFVWQNIRYSASWGEPDPVWHGFTTWSGNCYVHATTLKALLDAKGYETHLIWTKEKSHYWVLVKLEEGWRHMDATPSEQHLRVLYMKDWDRYVNLDGRDWDREAWPKAE